MKNYNETTVNRKHKDRLFRFIFKEKKDLLSLYNAVNGTDYANEEDLIINTLENVIYMNMHNDLSFLIYDVLNLYEHQGSWNPNMPLRELIYFIDLIKGYLEEHGYDIYGSKRIPLPTPQAIVFYNGTDEQPERQILKLSDAYQNKDKKGCLEFECLVLNVNYGKNKELMEKCKRLEEYAKLIHTIRDFQKRLGNIKKAVDAAIDSCIQDGILSDFLRRYRGMVASMILTQYDEQKHIENEKRWSYEEGERQGRIEGERQGRIEGERQGRIEGERQGRIEGERQGRIEGIELINKLVLQLLQDGKQEHLERALMDSEYRLELLKEYNLE